MCSFYIVLFALILLPIADKDKFVPVLLFNRAKCHEGVLGSGSIAPSIPDPGTRWR